MTPASQKGQIAAFEAMFKHASLGIIISNQAGQIIQTNPATDQLFGYQPGELIGQKIEVLIPDRMKAAHVQHREKYNQYPTPRFMGMGIDLLALKKDGTVFPVEISLATYTTGGDKEIVSFISDITKRKKDGEALKMLNEQLKNKVVKRTEALSQAIMELQQMNETLNYEVAQRKRIEEEARLAFEKEKSLGELKSRFVSMASHEFRTPLSGILTSVSLIDRYNQAGTKEKIDKHVQKIKGSVHSLTSILNDFLSLDKLDEGRIECHPEPFLIQELAEDLAQEMETLTKKNQKIIYEHQGSNTSLFLDKGLVRNIIINLLSNALKYSFDDTDIQFTTKIQDKEVSITVQDEGIGIPTADQEHLFGRFFRAQNATNISGTGLGLNIVKKYLDLMAGTISYKSQENVGTTFVVVLPRELKE